MLRVRTLNDYLSFNHAHTLRLAGEEDVEIDELEDDEGFEEEPQKPPPSQKLKLKFKVNPSKASSSSTANKRKRTEEPAPRRSSGRAVKKVSMAEDGESASTSLSDGSDAGSRH